jgi:S1-C subfamily serine protease
MSPGRRRVWLVACALLAGACGAAGTAGEPPAALRVTVATGGLVPQVATGVATADGRVLTVAHVLSGGHGVQVAGRRARILRVDRRLDLALLAVPGLRAPVVRLGGEARRVEIAVVQHRRARSVMGTIRRRVLIRWRDQPTDPPQPRPGLELAARIDPGDSGAPVVDRRGRLLGVVFARSGDRDDRAWAIDASAVRALLGACAGRDAYGTSSSLPVVFRAARSSCARRASASG